MEIEERKIRYHIPTRIVACEGKMNNVKTLLENKDDQIYLFDKDLMQIEGPGFIVLDFGQEMCGGIRILSSVSGPLGETMKVRIRFGESVSETYSEIMPEGTATNNHAMRDFYYEITGYADQLIGDTGFRFVRIDFLSDSPIYLPIKSIFAYEWYRDLKEISHYQSKDPLLQQIYDTSLRTVTLCMQNRIWDGIKRDRLVWIGDMEPEIHAILSAYGNVPIIEKTIETAILSNPMPCWINNIPSYSAWFLLIIYDIYKMSRDKAYPKKHLDYLNQIIDLFDKSLDDKGYLDFAWSYNLFPCAMPYFIDWPTYTEDNEKERREAVTMLLQYVFPKVLGMYEDVGLKTTTIEKIINKLSKPQIDMPKTKVFAAFYQLLHQDETSYQILIKDDSKGFSTFMSYYLLKAISQKDKNKAKELLKQYYGGMLSRGATSFWEDFHIEWLEGSSRIDELPKEGEKDLHGDYGGYCYVGFRHSLCHGWSSGPVSFLLEEDKE